MSALARLGQLLANGGDLSSFRFEFRRTFGLLYAAGCYRYDDLAQVAGIGIVRRTLYASMMDPKAETGVWQARIADPEAMRNLAQAIVDAKLDEVPPLHVEPGNLMFWVRIGALEGDLDTLLLSGDVSSHKRVLAPIRTAMAPMLDEAARNPVRTLGMELEMPIRLPRGKVRAPVQLTFRNSGSQAHWVRNPYSPLYGKTETGDVRHLIYRLVPPSSPTGPTPMPSQPLYATLDVAPENKPEPGEEKYVLLEPGAAMTFEFTVALDLSKPGRYCFDAQYGAFASSEAIEGVPRWAGCAGSNRAELNIA